MYNTQIPMGAFNGIRRQINFRRGLTAGMQNPVAGASGVARGAVATGSKVATPFARKIDYGKLVDTAGNALGEILPVASNIVNSFRRAPAVPVPSKVPYMAPRRVHYTDQLVENSRAVRGGNENAARILDAPSAAAVQTANMIQGIRGSNQTLTQEANTNAGLAMEAARMNAGISMQNTGIENQYRNDQVGRVIDQQGVDSANVANAVDKVIAIRNEKDKRTLDESRWGILSSVMDQDGVMTRILENLRSQGIVLPDYMTTGKQKKAHGGELKGPGEQGVDRYSVWGKLSDTIRGEGWKPASWDGSSTEYIPGYAYAGSNVMIGNKPTGSVRVRGNNNGKFDVYVKDNAGNSPDHYILQGVDANTAHGYFTQAGNTIDQRTKEIAKMSYGGTLRRRKIKV